MDTKEKVIAILAEIKPTKDLSGLNNIVEGGFLDSFELMQLISLLSESFGVEIGIEEIAPENFNSADAMAKMVDRLIAGK